MTTICAKCGDEFDRNCTRCRDAGERFVILAAVNVLKRRTRRTFLGSVIIRVLEMYADQIKPD
jgi:hypothetical protein